MTETYILCTPGGFYLDPGQRITLRDIGRLKSELVRVNGDACCYPVLEELLPAGGRVQVCAPQFWSQRSLLQAFSAVKSLRVPVLQGGFRDVTADELPWYHARYRIDSIMPRTGAWFTTALPTDFKVPEPLWERVRFIRPEDEEALARVLLMIFDIRFFTFPEIGTVKLKRYMRLGRLPRSLRRQTDDRYLMLRQVWKNVQAAADIKYGRGRIVHDDSYFMAYWRKMLHKHESENRADVKTCARYIDYLYYLWLDYLYPNTGDGWFVPERFFTDDPAQVQSWKQWQAARK